VAVIKWNTPETIASYLTTQLNSLANNAFSSSGATIDNLTDLYLYINLELVLAAQGTARSSGAYVEVWMERTLDGTNYEDRANAAFTQALLTAFQLDAATTARRLVLTNVVIPPVPFRLYVRNLTGQAFAASGNTLRYRRHNESSV
jgi:hypothetical protein